MFYFSRNLVIFIVLTFIYSMTFNQVLEGHLLFKDWMRAAGISFLYFLVIIVTGAILSGKDRSKLLRSRCGFMLQLQ